MDKCFFSDSDGFCRKYNCWCSGDEACRDFTSDDCDDEEVLGYYEDDSSTFI